jgi:hypothetical protein
MRDVTTVMQVLERHLRSVGGLVSARLKLERAVRWKLCGGTEPSDLPPITDQIKILP